MNVLVTGSFGFTGRNIYTPLKNDLNIKVVGVDRVSDDYQVDYVCDLTDYNSVYEMLHYINPDQIYNVAGSITNNYEECYTSNIIIAKNLLDNLSTMKFNGRLLLVGSSAEYGLVNKNDLPVKETQPPNPVSMYGLTKVYQTVLMNTYRNLYCLDVVMVRPFNLIGDGISENLFPGHVQKSIEDFKTGKIKKIRVGSLNTRRDFIHIAQAVKDYQLVMKAGISGEIYNIGTGKSILLRHLLNDMLKVHGLNMAIVEEIPMNAINKVDVPDIYADISKLGDLRSKT